jgi:serine/threonine protein kinase
MIGKTVSHYRITSQLGAGGMGEVFLAEDTRLERKAAIKFLPADMAADPDRRQRFLKEARAASALNHPHVCIVYDVGETEDGLPFIAMEYIDGGSLDSVLKTQRLEITQIVDLAVQVADALDAAHACRIVHRDIKPANISLNERGQVKVLDFGLAKRMPQESTNAFGTTASIQQTLSGQVLGTPSYMSPEQALGKDLDHRTDIFSAGVVLYELTTGRRPFTGANLGEILDKIVHAQPKSIARLNYDVPPELERITLKCLQKSPDRRYQSARELLVDLRNLARELEHGRSAAVSVSLGRVEPAKPVGGNRGGIAAEPFSLEKLKGSDVLLNYAAIDDFPLHDGKPGWVSQLHRNLEVRMEQLSGEKVHIARLPEDAISPVIEAELLQHVPRAKAMISVVSPPFINSPLCRREVEQFWQGAEQTGGRYIKEKSRLLKVLKTAISEQQMPRPLVDIFSPLFGFEFFELDAETGRVREFDETFGPVLKQRFFERVYDLAYDGCQVLSLLKQFRARDVPPAAADSNRRWVYLATTTSDVADERDRIKRELLER